MVVFRVELLKFKNNLKIECFFDFIFATSTCWITISSPFNVGGQTLNIFLTASFHLAMASLPKGKQKYYYYSLFI